MASIESYTIVIALACRTTEAGGEVSHGAFGRSTVLGDTLVAYAKGEVHRIALSDIRELLVKRKDPGMSALLTVASLGSIIVIVTMINWRR